MKAWLPRYTSQSDNANPARVPNGEIVAAFASDVETIRKLDATRAARWRALLEETRHVGPALADCPLIEETLRCSHAPTFILDRCAGEDWLAAGDAASAYDPISAGGIYKALDDGLRAGSAIVQALAGDASALDDYHASVAARFRQYLANRSYFYSLERRFAGSEFWARRRRRHPESAKRDEGSRDAKTSVISRSFAVFRGSG